MTQPRPRQRAVRILKRAARLLAIAYLSVCLLMMFVERYLVYPIPPVDRSDWSPGGSVFEDVGFSSADGTRLHGWFLEHPAPRRAVLYCHGNGEQVADNADTIVELSQRLDASVFLFDYRGYGKSRGKPFERGVIDDGLAAQRWLAERTGRRADEVTLVGRSIGGGVAVACAAELGAEALVLQSTFTRLTDAAAHHFPWLPVRWLMRNRFDSLKRVAAFNGPVFSSHGTDDFVVPFEQGEALFEVAPGRPKEFFTIEGGDHNDPQPRDYYAALRVFLDGLPTVSAAADSNTGNR